MIRLWSPEDTARILSRSKLNFQGTGYATVVMSFLYGSYFTTIIVYCQFYFFNSFHGILPWSSCQGADHVISENENNLTSLNWWATKNCTDAKMNQSANSVPVTQEYFDNFVLHKTSGIEEVLFQFLKLGSPTRAFYPTYTFSSVVSEKNYLV